MKNIAFKPLVFILVSLLFTACGGSSSVDTDGDEEQDSVTDGDGIVADGDFIQPDGDLSEGETADGDNDGDMTEEEEGCTGCLINEVCIPEGQSHADKPCAVCDPEQNAEDWSPKEATVPCRPVAGACDPLAEYCDGISLDCPADSFSTNAVECREAAGECDMAEFCPGDSEACPAEDLKWGEETVCKPSGLPCDMAEFCDGVNDDCPADAEPQYGDPCNDELTCSLNDICDGGGKELANCMGAIYSYDYGELCTSSNHSSDCQIGNLSLLGGYTGMNEARHVFVQGERAYVCEGSTTTGKFYILDISNPADIEYLGKLENLYMPTGSFVRGDKAYVIEYDGKLRIVDISTPPTLSILGTYTAPAGESRYYKAIRVDGDLAYVVNYHEGVNIIDVSIPATPNRIERISYMNESYSALEVQNDYLYALEYDDGLKIFNVSDPENPELLSTTHIGLESSSRAQNVFLQDHVAYVATDDNIIFSLNISDPNLPLPLDSLTWQYANFRNLWVEGNLIYMQEYGRIIVIDVSDPADMTRIGELSLPQKDEARTIFVSNHRAYVPHQLPANAQGLAIADLSLCTCSAGFAPTKNGCESAIAPLAEGDLIISEFMANAGQSSFRQLEWLEIYNPNETALDLADCLLISESGFSHTFESLGLPPMDYTVIGNAGNPFTAYMTPIDYVIPDLSLADEGEGFAITCDGETIDAVDYLEAQVSPGASLKRDPDGDAIWCLEDTETFGDLNIAELYGSPGAANTPCP